jgi:hypothetical protein
MARSVVFQRSVARLQRAEWARQQAATAGAERELLQQSMMLQRSVAVRRGLDVVMWGMAAVGAKLRQREMPKRSVAAVQPADRLLAPPQVPHEPEERGGEDLSEPVLSDAPVPPASPRPSQQAAQLPLNHAAFANSASQAHDRAARPAARGLESARAHRHPQSSQ